MTAATETTQTTTQQATTQTTEAAPPKEVTLDDVYREAGLDKTPEHQTQQPERQQQRAEPQEQRREPSSIPDPYDTENFKAYLARKDAGTTELHKAVNQIAAHLTESAKARALEATKADIDKAVSTINETVNHSKPKVIEAALDGMVREDPRLKAIWENRAKNPNAWANALKIVTKQISEDFSVKVDPTLVAAQRARKDSQRQMATTTESNASPAEERLAAAQGSDFDIEWQKLLGHG